MSSAIKKRSLILTFDAFGTLIKPRIPIVDQYREEAAKFGVKFKKAEHLSAIIGKEFKTAFNIVKQQNPNFGAGDRAIGYEKWWHLVIQRTLEPHITTSIPPELAPSLLKRFSSAEGYELHHDVLHFLRSVSSNNPPWRYPPLVTIPPGSPTPSQDTPMTIFGILSNGDPRISLILDSLGISKYFSFQLLSYQTGHVKPSREAFRLARQTGLMIGKGDPTYKTKDPHTGKELRKTWLGWDFVHVGDDIFEDWLAARKLPDVQPVWVDRERLGLSVTDLEKFRKRGEDKFPMQMLHMAEGMKGWDTKKMSAAERRELMELMKTNANSMQCMHELLNSTISDLTELPCLFRDIDPPPESADVPIALADPDKWDEELQKWRDEKSRANLEAQEKDAKMRLLMREKRGPRQKTFSFGRKSDGRGKHSRGSTRGNEERTRENVERIEGNMRNAGVWGDAQRPEPQPEFLGMAYRRIKLSSNMRSDMRSDMHGKKREKMHGHKRGKMTHKRGKTGGNRRK